MVAFVQAIYALVTFVHISNISDVIGPNLIKLFGPNILGVIFFVDQNALGPDFFRPKFLLYQMFFPNSKFFSGFNFFQIQNFFEPTILLTKFVDPNLWTPKIYWTHNFFGANSHIRTLRPRLCMGNYPERLVKHSESSKVI